jgi:hypothetical protein
LAALSHVREDHLMTVQEAVRKVTSLPAYVLSLPPIAGGGGCHVTSKDWTWKLG